MSLNLAPRLSPTPKSTVKPEMEYGEAMEQLFVEKFTGAALTHFSQGVPQEVQPLVPATRIRIRRAKKDIDKGRNSAHP